MREIKFRAWNILTKQMMNNEDLWDIPYNELFIHTPDSRPFNMMQYTGLKDKNGKEIYEGDILGGTKNTDPNGIMKNIVIYEYEGFKHKWLDERTARIRDKEIDPIFRNTHIVFEVIGNIYENPELLGGNEDDC